MKASPEPVGERLARLIREEGPISVARFMAEANAHYYATRDPFGQQGDFTTAPEISQMFGELIGIWLVDLWQRAGRPHAHYVELGPGRGTLAADALRVMRAAGFDPPGHLVETSPVLRKAQAERLPAARWHDDVSTLPQDAPLLIVANEFFDALPIEQWLVTPAGKMKLAVSHEEGRFVRTPADPALIVETSPVSLAIVGDLARRLAAQGGAMLAIDYGHVRSGLGDTLQSLSGHRYADPWAEPGERDLTVHVDFEALESAARAEGAAAFGPVTQGEWLRAMGIDARAATLTGSAPEHARQIEGARERLAGDDQMGRLFKVLALTGKSWPEPAGMS